MGERKDEKGERGRENRGRKRGGEREIYLGLLE